MKNKDDDSWRFRNSPLRLLLLPVLIFLGIMHFNDFQGQRQSKTILQLMENYQWMDAITINGLLVANNEDDNFNEVKDKMNPFYLTAGGIPRRERRKLQQEAHEVFAEISFYQQDNHLFSLTVYTFLNHPIPNHVDNPNTFTNNVFKIDDLYAVAIINNTNFLGNFRFDNWNDIEI